MALDSGALYTIPKREHEQTQLHLGHLEGLAERVLACVCKGFIGPAKRD